MILADVQLPYRLDAGRPILKGYAGGRRVLLIDEGAMNRAAMAVPGSPFSDYNRSAPPDPAALASIAPLIRNPSRYGMGAGPVSAIIHLEGNWETIPPLSDQVEAVRALRRNLSASAEVSIGIFPGVYSPADPAWADAAAVVTAPCWEFYPWNEVARHGVDYWLGEIADAGRRFKEWFPRRRKKIAYVSPFFQICWKTDPQYADVLGMDGEPVPVEDWRRVIYRLRDDGWDVYPWGPQPPFDHAAVADHLAITADVFGLDIVVP